VSGPATGEPGRGIETPKRTAGTRDAAGAILIVLALGLAARLILTQVLPGSGFGVDLQAFRFWAGNLAAEGPYGFYERDFFHDYTPGYLYILWGIGLLGQLTGNIGDLIKLPAIVSDVVLGWLVWSMARELGAGRRAALLGGAIVVVNPITWFDSVLWGQVDSVGVVFLLLALRELWRDRTERAAILTVVAAIVKPQLGILVPLVAAVTIRRALWPRGGYGHEGAPGSADSPAHGGTTLGWERRVRGPIRILSTGIAGLLTAVVLSAGFGLSIVDLVVQVGSAAATYPYLSVNAWNPWALLSLDGQGIAVSGQWVCDVVVPSGPGVAGCPQAYMFGPVPALVVGTVLMLAAVIAVTLAVARRPDRRTMLVGLAVLALVFFVVPTRVHERYLFPFFIIGALLAAVSVRWRIAYVLLSLATFANLYVVLTTLYPGNPGIADWLGIGPGLRSETWVTIVAAVHLAGLAFAATQLRGGALERLGDEVYASDAPDLDLDDDAEEVVPAAAPDAGGAAPAHAWAEPAPVAAGSRAARSAAAGQPAIPAAPYRSPQWSERPGLAEAGVLGWLRGRLGDAPVRADRSAQLRHERGGRFARLDAWILIILVVAALGLRLWRLPEPYRMHFDEVYHARTATEFLQHWRYGLSHDIYEWTHPHLAKYAMAGGLAVLGADEIEASTELGVPVRDAVVEPRRDDLSGAGARLGDRLHVATGDEVRVYDLRTRSLEARFAIPGATRFALDPTGQRLFVAGADGAMAVVDLATLDTARAENREAGAGAVTAFGRLDAAPRVLHVTGDGSGLIAALEGDTLVSLEASSGAELGRAELDGIEALADAGQVPVLVARPAEVSDPAAVASELAGLLGRVASVYEALLTAGGDRVVIEGVEASGSARTALDAAITAGRLPGLSVQSVSRVAVATADGVAFVSRADAEILQELRLEGGAQGLAYVQGIDKPKLYVTTNPADGPAFRVMNLDPEVSGNVTAGQEFRLPGAGSAVRWNDAAQQLYILGEPPPGRPAGQVATVYVVEPHANAVYADTALPFVPAALVLDTNPLFPSSDRSDVLAIAPSGTAATIDAGSQAWAWRVPGVLAGVLMAALLYVLARILFERRSVAILVGVLCVLDGMLFVQSRIGMNDAYVALFIVAAYTLFAALWTGRWRWRGAFWVTMPAIGVLLGLALASKWVAAYSIGALGILVLARSALGRLVLLAGLIAVTTVLGYLGMSVPPDTPATAGWQILGFVLQGNLTFMLIMVALTLIAAVVIVVHPIAWSDDEVRFAVGAPAASGVLIALVALAAGRLDWSYALGPVAVTPLHLGFALVVASLAVYAVLRVAAWRGVGPLAPPPEPDSPSRWLEPAAEPPGWLRPGWALGLPVAWMLVSLLAIPIAVYVLSYVPWAWVENHRIVEGWPAGATGQTLLELTGQMYSYHNGLSSGHAASSPWWAWPLDLKPVWFYQQSYAGGTSGAIYDAGNQLLWWLGIPALVFCAVQSFRRRSLPLALIAIGFACQWIAWARIDRAAFQYHYYTALPFVVLAVAYFLAELWHGASRRTWLVARLAAAPAVVLPALMWLVHRPLCGYVRVLDANPGSQACPTLIPEFVLSARSLAVGAVVVLAAIVVIRQILALDRPGDGGWLSRRRGPLGGLLEGWVGVLVTSGATALLLLVATIAFAEVPLLTMRGVSVEPIAVVVLVPLLGMALVVASARDARRFVAGTLAAIVAFSVVWYPNLSALPLPSQVVNTYQGFLPTYLYPFQFPVSTVNRNVAGPPLIATGPALLFLALTVTCVVIAWSAWSWRMALAERGMAEAAAAEEAGSGPALGTSGG